MRKRVACRGKIRNLYTNFVGNLDWKELDYLVHLVVDGRIMLKWLLKKLGMMVRRDTAQ
jgi:hypothetical protein